MKRRTRLRKQGLPADPPKMTRPAPPTLATVARELAQVLTTRGFMHPTHIQRLCADPAVLRSAQLHGVEGTANMLIRYGLTPSELRERLL